MTYQVLARKWRPRTFSEVVGQEHVVRALGNALDNGRLHHAYLFTGTRGVGKTTLARILAKALNCEEGVRSEPCGRCSACLEVDEGRFPDLIEVDAASRTKVDQTRELLENVPYAPIRGRFKVYLIDEVHMFSDSSFNALLKTLEEPPEHVKFLLATTDPQKVPVTVLSRCLQLNLKRLPVARIRGQFEHILKAESIPWEAAALDLLARAADGSMRDGLSLLDQAIGHGGGRVAEEDVKAMLGVLSQDRLPGLMERVAEGDAPGLLEEVATVAETSPDFGALLKDLLLMLHRVALLQLAPDAVDESWGDPEPLRRLAGRLHPEEVQLFYEIALRGRQDLPLAPDPRSGFEMVLLRMLAFRPEPEAVARDHAPGRGSVRSPSDGDAVSATGSTRPAQEEPAAGAASPRGKGTEVLDLTPERWPELVARLDLKGLAAQLAAHCVLRSWDGRRLVLALDERGRGLVGGTRAEQGLREALAAHLGAALTVDFEVQGALENTPARRAEAAAEQRRKAALERLREDPVVDELTRRFDAELVEESLKLIKK